MKKIVCLVIVFTSLALADTDNDKNCTSPGDNHRSIEHPCPNLDVPCVRSILSRRLRSAPVYEKKSGKYPYNNIPLFVPHTNVTIVWKESEISGLNDFEIKVFYINKTTNTMVLETILNSITIDAAITQIYYLRKGKEPVISSGKVEIIYRNVSLTMTIYDEKYSNEIYVFPYLLDANPSLHLAPSLAPSDPEAFDKFCLIMESLPQTHIEHFVTQGPTFQYNLMRNSFCKVPLAKLRY